MISYLYRVTQARIIDGDTVEATVDLGFRIKVTDKFRMTGFNAPELDSKDEATQAIAKESKEKLNELFGKGPILIKSMKPIPQDKYGRWLGYFYTMDMTCINEKMKEWLLQKGWDANTPKSWDK